MQAEKDRKLKEEQESLDAHRREALTPAKDFEPVSDAEKRRRKEAAKASALERRIVAYDRCAAVVAKLDPSASGSAGEPPAVPDTTRVSTPGFRTDTPELDAHRRHKRRIGGYWEGNQA